MKYFTTFITITLLLFSTPSLAAAPQPATAQHAMVVSSQHLATETGVAILKQGGNAIDAAVAMGYALAVVHPCCGNIGGGGFMLIHLADGKNTFINFREKAPAAIKASLFEDAQGNLRKNALSGGYIAGNLSQPYLPVGVPGTVLGLNTALQKYGTFPLQRIIQPAIALAKNGFILAPGDITFLHANTHSFIAQPNVAAIFLKNQQPYQAGDRLIQTDLANTLMDIAAHGSNAFYRGTIADKIVTASQNNGGILTKQDLANYTLREQTPITCQYRGYTVVTAPPPSSGVTICEMLNIVDGYPLHKLGYHSAESAHYNLEAMRYAFADRNTYLGDPDFIKIPVAHLISPQYAAQIREHIAPDKAGDSHRIGFSSQPKENANTTSFVVLDEHGNAVAVTYTIDDYFGAKIIPGNTGFFLNNELGDFTIKANTPNPNGLVQGTANLIAPNKRPLSSMSPTLLMKNHKVLMLLGTPGGGTITTQIVETIENVVDYDMNVKAAVDAPRYHMQWLPDVVYMEPNAFSNETIKKLIQNGYTLKLGSPYGTPEWGAVTAIVVDPKTKLLTGAIDRRRPAGLALGY